MLVYLLVIWYISILLNLYTMKEFELQKKYNWELAHDKISSHYIGEQFGGGVIFHLWKDAEGLEHGLIVDTVNLSDDYIWSNITNVLIGPSAESTWDGLNNSIAIANQPGQTTSAAKLCLDSTNNGFSDWYLPAMDELNLLYVNRFNVNKTLNNILNAELLNLVYYWSSTEFNTNEAFRLAFVTGTMQEGQKIGETDVRAIRQF